MDIGGFLKQERKKRNISISTVSSTLKISKGYLIAIESDEYEKIPGKAYSIAFLRSYGEFLNLDSDKIIEEYRNQIELSKNLDPIELPKPAEVFDFFKIPKIISFAVVLIIAIPIYLIFQNNLDNQSNFAITPDIPVILESKIEEIEVKDALKKIQDEDNELKLVYNQDIVQNTYEQDNINPYTSQTTVMASKPTVNEVSEAENLISLKAINSTWIQLRDDESNIIFSKLMDKNEVYNYYTKDNFFITTGNAGNIIVTIGGNIMGKLGAKGEVLDSIAISSEYFSN